MKKWWKGVKIAVLVYALIGIALYFLQTVFLFHPKKLPADYQYQFDQPFRQLDIPVNKKKILSVVQFTVPDSLRKGIVLYFHGNRENINRYAKYAPSFTRQGYEVWMMDYPGFGKSTGKRSERIIYEDAIFLYKLAIRQVSLEHIVIYGKSLGTGVAAQLASVRDCRRLILETPYYSIAALGHHYFPIYPAFPRYSFPTHLFLEQVHAPVTIFHGTSDQVIPYRQANWLAKEHDGTELITIEKGRHNNLPEFPLFQHKLDSLLQH